MKGSSGGGFLNFSASMDGFPFPPPLDGSCGGGFPRSSSCLDATGGEASSPGLWDSKESPIELDKFDRYSKFQETNNEKRMKLLDRQEKISSDKLQAKRIAQLIAQDYKEGKKFEKETKMMETYNNLASQDTSSMSDEEKAQRVSMMKKLEKTLFPETD